MNVIASLKDAVSFWRPRKPSVPFSVLFKKFKSILERNNRILELMSEMGDKLGGEWVFDRQYIYEVCERLNDLVFKLISDLCVLNQRKNVDLFIAFERIQHELQEELAGRHAFPDTKPTIPLDELNFDRNDEAGNKFASLGDIRNKLGLPTRDGFVITVKAFFDFMQHNGLWPLIDQAVEKWKQKDEASFEEMAARIQSFILTGEIPRSIVSNIFEMLDTLTAGEKGKDPRFAIRSSAWGEDGESSFAGQYDSILNVPRKEIPGAYKRVIASAYSVAAWHYRLHRGYREHETAMAVGCQVMVDAEVSGAMYTYAPLSAGDESMVISAAWGLGLTVVEGIAESDTIILDRTPPYTARSVDAGYKKNKLVVFPPGGIVSAEVSEGMREAICLTPGQIEQLAQTAMAIERYYKRPQDVEWAFDKEGGLFILQARPMNMRPRRPEGMPRIDDPAFSDRVIFSNKGTAIQRGVAAGKAFVVRNYEDLRRFPYGAILVAKHTSPRFSRIMPKVQGIITDIGSAAGHMATLAREYRVPTIVDTGVATSVLNTGEEITLDATQNRVYRGIIHVLSRFELTEEEVFEDTYEYRLMRRLLKKTNQLNLIDPHSEEFKGSRCRTYHDITRYIHEKAIENLINLSENYSNYHSTTPKRLEAELPLGLMVIDVENGSTAPPEARVLHPGDIASAPLRALLQGLCQSGMWATNPAPVDLRSFMSSFTKTFSASLAGPDRIGRNLAIISREYMNLNLRLGYHFNILDSYIGDTLNDNYIYFRFLGGVTDILRRSRRARFIAGVLEHFDFRVELHGDLVIGRMKKASRERMTASMKTLGGLIGYTRQLDVRMSNDEQVAWHLEDFTQRISALAEVSHECFS
jgi:pyruvate,water dikinase